jgi:3-deoxy-D-manno-octulosonic-acid transferase
LSVLAAQDQDTAQRFIDLGAATETVQVTGSLKFDLSIAEDLPQRALELKQQWQLEWSPNLGGSKYP